MIIPFNEISSQGSRYALNRIEGAGGDDWRLVALTQATCRLVKKSATRVLLSGRLQALLELQCDRCLEFFEFPVDTVLNLILSLDCGSWLMREVACTRRDLDTVQLTVPEVDLQDIFRQQVYLSLPMKKLCVHTCNGLCPQCGCNRNTTTCQCHRVQAASPFAVLAVLKQ